MAIQRSDIRSHATELYLSGGLEALSMRKLAGRLGVTAPAIYRYYASKEEVLRDMVREAYRQSASYIYRALSAATPLERFRRAGEENLDFALTHPRWYEMMYLSPERFGWSGLPARSGCTRARYAPVLDGSGARVRGRGVSEGRSRHPRRGDDHVGPLPWPDHDLHARDSWS